MRIRRLPHDPGPAAWSALLAPRAPSPPLDQRITADWLVIGAGFAGLAAARRLLAHHPGARIALLDAVRIGEGPAGRNSGFMIDLPHNLTSDNYSGAADRDRAQITANRAAIDFSLIAAEEYGLPAEAITRSGKINGAASARGSKHNRDYAAHLIEIGEKFELLDASAMRSLTGSGYYEGGVYTPGTAMLQPALFVRGMAAGLVSQGVDLFENSPVTALERAGQIWTATTPDGQVSAPKVILAVNGHAESFGHFQGRLIHLFLYGSMTRALSTDEVRSLGGEETWALTPADPMGTTVRRVSGTGGQRIIIRNRATYDPSMQIGEGRVARIGRGHDAAFRARFPALGNVEMEHRWGGRICLTRNDAAAFGEVDDGLYAACCQNGLGLARGTFNGIAAADLASGIETPFTDYQLSRPRPVRLPPEPIAWIGATATIKWGERAAGREL